MPETPEQVIARLTEENGRLRDLLACMYQVAGANLLPLRFMDALSLAEHGMKFNTDKLLPYSAEENGKEWTASAILATQHKEPK